MARTAKNPAEVAFSTTVLLAGAVFGALFWFGQLASLFGIWLLFVVGIGFVAYVYSVAAATATGLREPPPVATSQFNAVNVSAQVLHAVAWTVGIVWSLRYPPLGIAVTVVAPASFLLMATTQDLVAAFSPLQIGRLIARMGVTYAMLLGAATLLGLLIWQSERLSRPLVTSLLQCWGLLAMAAIGGHFVYRRLDRLNLPVTTVDEKRVRDDRVEEARKWQGLMDEAYLLLRSGEAEKAYTMLRGQIERDGHSVASYEAVYERIRDWGMQDHCSQVARRLVERLVATGDLQHALEVTEERLRHDDAFRPPMACLPRLIAHARAVGHTATAGLLGPDQDLQ